MIAKIASFLYHPQDLCYFLLGGKQLLTAAQEARVRLKLTNTQKNQIAAPQHAAQLRRLVTSIVKYFPGELTVQLTPRSSTPMQASCTHGAQADYKTHVRTAEAAAADMLTWFDADRSMDPPLSCVTVKLLICYTILRSP